jgi:hypothetical protein
MIISGSLPIRRETLRKRKTDFCPINFIEVGYLI